MNIFLGNFQHLSSLQFIKKIAQIYCFISEVVNGKTQTFLASPLHQKMQKSD